MFFPALFVAVVVEDDGGDAALGIMFKDEPSEWIAVGVEKDAGRLGGELVGLALPVFEIEIFALANDADLRAALAAHELRA